MLGSFVPEEDTYKNIHFSQAGCRFQLKLLSSLKPQIAISVIPSFCDLKFSPGRIEGVLYARAPWDTGTLLRKVSRIVYLSWTSVQCYEKRKVKKLLIYNIDSIGILVYLLNSLSSSIETYFLIADWPHSASRVWRYYLKRIVSSASGVITLSSRITLHSNQLVIPGIAEVPSKSQATNGRGAKNKLRALLAGSLGITTGLEVALKAASINKSTELIITGRPFRMSEKQLIKLIKSYGDSCDNIKYKGLSSRDEYEQLLNSVDVVLSLRNPADPEHIGNIPSKVIEAASAGVQVISTMRYPELSEVDLVYCDFSAHSLNTALESILALSSLETACVRNRIKCQIQSVCGRPVAETKILKFLNDSNVATNCSRVI